MVWACERVGAPLGRIEDIGVCVGSGRGVAIVLENPGPA